MSRRLKGLAAAALMVTSLAVAAGGLAWAESTSFGAGAAKAAPPGWHGRYVAGIEVLTANPTFLKECGHEPHGAACFCGVPVCGLPGAGLLRPSSDR